MKELYIAIDITYYGKADRYDCYLSQSVDDEGLTMEKLPLNKALKLMWELKLAGGTKEVRINRLNPSIVTRYTSLYVSF